MRAYEARRRISLVDVLNEYGDVCHICGTAVEIEVRPPHPLAATIDHVFPLIRGGGDDLCNVRPAHFACNRKKGASLPSIDEPKVSSTDRSIEMKNQLTKPPTTVPCRWCGRAIVVVARPGRPREFCKASCRQMDYEARRRAKELGLSENELVVTRRELDELRDALYVVECAVEDVTRDLEEAGNDPAEVRRALDWLLDAVRPLIALRP